MAELQILEAKLFFLDGGKSVKEFNNLADAIASNMENHLEEIRVRLLRLWEHIMKRENYKQKHLSLRAKLWLRTVSETVHQDTTRRYRTKKHWKRRAQRPHWKPHPRFRNLHLDYAWYSATRRNELSGYTDGNQLPARFALRVYHTVKVVFLSLLPNCLTAASWMPDGMVVIILWLFTACLLLFFHWWTPRKL